MNVFTCNDFYKSMEVSGTLPDEQNGYALSIPLSRESRI